MGQHQQLVPTHWSRAKENHSARTGSAAGSASSQSVDAPDYVASILAKAEAGGVHEAELAALRRRLKQLGEPWAGLLPSEALEPLPDLPRLDELPEPPPGQARDVLDRLVVVKLNGGLGTSMGLSGPKSLLEIKPARAFSMSLLRRCWRCARGMAPGCRSC